MKLHYKSASFYTYNGRTLGVVITILRHRRFHMAKSLTNYFIFTQKRRFDSRSWRFSRQSRRYFSRFSGEQRQVKNTLNGGRRVCYPPRPPARALSFQSYEKRQKINPFLRAMA